MKTESVDFGYMVEIGEWKWGRLRFQTGYDQALINTPDHEPKMDIEIEKYKAINQRPDHNNNRLYIDEQTTTEHLEAYSVGYHAPRGETWEKHPKAHVWRYSGRPNKGNIEPLAKLIGSHLEHGKTGQHISIEETTYTEGGTTRQRLRERLDVPKFLPCGHKCQRYLSNNGSDTSICCRCAATAMWFGVESKPFNRDKHTLAEAVVWPATTLGEGKFLYKPGEEAIYKPGYSYTLSFKNGIVGPDASQFYIRQPPEWEGLSDHDPTEIEAKHFGWWAGLFRPLFLRPKSSWNEQLACRRLVDGVSVISGRRNIHNFLCLPCLSACKGVPSWMFHVARGYDTDTAKRFHAAEVKALCHGKKIKNPVTYNWKRNDLFPIPGGQNTAGADWTDFTSLYLDRTWEQA